MASNAELIIAALRQWPGLDDDQLSKQSGVEPRQTINQICRRLELEGRLRRHNGPEGKIINTLTGSSDPQTLPPQPAERLTVKQSPNNFQRVGSISNAHAGRDFETAASEYFASIGIILTSNFPIEIGYTIKRPHRFDLGSFNPATLVECKSYTWTSGGNSPSAKIRSMNEVMLYFSLSPADFRKILFMLKHMRGEISLAASYIKNQGHLIPPETEIWEFDPQEMLGTQLL